VKPIPLSTIVSGEPGASLVKDALPVVLFASRGVNSTANPTDCPGVRVIGKVSPLTLKPTPVTILCEMVAREFPVLLSKTDCVPLLPTATFPKLSEAALAESCAT
jgi:hypothetical protein